MAETYLANIITLPARLRATRLRQDELAASNEHLKAALGENKREGQKLAVQARWIALAIIAVLLPLINPDWSVLYYQVLLVGFALLGWAQLRAAKVGQSRMELLLVFADLALLTFVVLVPNPFFDQNWPLALQFRFDNFVYFYVLLAGATLAYSWRTLFAIGTWTAGLWAAGLVYVVFLGQTVPELTHKLQQAFPDDADLVELINPNNILLGLRIQEIIVFLIVAGILALNGWRNSQLLLRQAEAARERANLARYFPPGIVDQMADEDQPLGQIRAQKVAVMFADIVGFSSLAEQEAPENTVAMLRQFHQHMENAVFENNGTLDKFLGDGIMATFGTPKAGPDDAANALNCARAMLSAIDAWNNKRKFSGDVPIKLSIGIHYGEVILGNIGSKRRLEFATLGDTVNIASRLEELTRKLGTQLVTSNDVIDAAKRSSRNDKNTSTADLSRSGARMLRGRTGKTEIWTLENANPSGVG